MHPPYPNPNPNPNPTPTTNPITKPKPNPTPTLTSYKAALAFTCCVHLLRRWARLPRLLHRLLCAVVLLVLGVDLFLRRNAGVA